ALAACLAWFVVSCVTPPAGLPEGPYVLVLGTAQDGGLPQLGCRRTCCETARKDPHKKRLVTSLLLVDPRSGQRWLFDASPDLPEQVERARDHGGPGPDAPGRPALFDGIFLTHAH
ncbi:MAG TPA: pyrroloquinoline quinone biosynthesis protein PqqB, partial [Planctomycetota bacterium]|nr:pyrroloquinoline quinone biosynthesis protein PqqB [Planctomycetota bacterium]